MYRLAMLFLVVAPAWLRADSHTLTVQVQGIRSSKGEIEAALYNQPQGFPAKPDKAMMRRRVSPSGDRVEIEFTQLPSGTYAISVYHDANGNGKLDTNLIGMPKEPVAVSNNAKGKLGPPSFKDAQFTVSASTAIAVTLE